MSKRTASGPTAAGVRARESARLAAEQAARRRRDRNLLLVLVVAVVVLVVGGGIGLQAYRTGRAPTAIRAVAVSEAAQPVTEGQPVRFGPEGAPVTVTLYEDFQCPHCADFAAEFGPTLAAAQTAGTLKTELYPMSFINASSASTANAFACAGEAGFAERYHLGLFANQELRWTDAQLLDLATKVGGTSTDAFAACVTSRALAGWVASINTAADTNGVSGTPTMFLNGQPVAVDGLTPARLQAMIDSGTAE